MSTDLYTSDGSYFGTLVDDNDYGPYEPSAAIRKHAKQKRFKFILIVSAIMLILNLAPFLFMKEDARVGYIYDLPLFLICLFAFLFSAFTLIAIQKILKQIEGELNPYIYQPDKHGDHKIDLNNTISREDLKSIVWKDKALQKSAQAVLAHNQEKIHIDQIIGAYTQLKLSWTKIIFSRLHLLVYPLFIITLILSFSAEETIGYYLFIGQVSLYAPVFGVLSIIQNIFRYKNKGYTNIKKYVILSYVVAIVLSLLLLIVDRHGYGILVYIVSLAEICMVLSRVFFKPTLSHGKAKHNLFLTIFLPLVFLFVCFMAVLAVSLFLPSIRDAIIAYDNGTGGAEVFLTFWGISGAVSLPIALLIGVIVYRKTAKPTKDE